MNKKPEIKIRELLGAERKPVYREFLNNPATWSPMLAKAMREKQGGKK